MNTIRSILEGLIGEWSPISAGEHFAGIDFQWLACVAVVAVILFGLFGLVRAVFRR